MKGMAPSVHANFPHVSSAKSNRSRIFVVPSLRPAQIPAKFLPRSGFIQIELLYEGSNESTSIGVHSSGSLVQEFWEYSLETIHGSFVKICL